MDGTNAATVVDNAAFSVPAQRLRAATHVRATFGARRTAGSGVAVVYVRSRGDAQPPRFTVVAGKAVGNAVVRNRVKRRLRAAVRELVLDRGNDYVVVGRPDTAAVPFAELTATLQRQFAAATR